MSRDRCRLSTSSIPLLAMAMLTAVLGAPAQAASPSPSAGSGSLSEYCAARVEDPSGPTDKKGLTKAARKTLDELTASAPTPEQAAAVARMVGLFDKRGLAAFTSLKAQQSLQAIDAFTYANCGFTQLSVTAQDYAYGGIPASLAAGTIALKLTNLSSDVPHEIVVSRIAPSADTSDPAALLALPAKKAAKVLEFRQYARVAPGESAVSITPLEPGTYVAGCFLPTSDEKGAPPSFTEGMYATFQVTA